MKKTGALMRAFTILGLLLAVALMASPAMGASDEPLTIKSMKVSVWPEYDDPRILVTYQGEFKNGASFPQPVKFPVPLGSEMNQVCALQPPNNEHLCQLYDMLTESDDLAVAFTLPIPTYYLEYYWDAIKAQPDKSFTFKYVSPYAVDTLELEVQQPLKATSFELAQPYISATSDSRGMKYYRYLFSNVTPGQVISIDASYTKPDNRPSVAKETSSAGNAGGSAAGSSAYGVIGIGAALLAAAAVGFVLLRRKPAAAPARTAPSRRAARIEARRAEVQRAETQPEHRPPTAKLPRPKQPARAAPAAKPDQPGTGAVFCRKCGTKLAAGAIFCHLCGEKAKGSD
ncbi:MAG: zinc ribbon domain-containing protein [Chloroflexota bacterium]